MSQHVSKFGCLLMFYANTILAESVPGPFPFMSVTTVLAVASGLSPWLLNSFEGCCRDRPATNPSQNWNISSTTFGHIDIQWVGLVGATWLGHAWTSSLHSKACHVGFSTLTDSLAGTRLCQIYWFHCEFIQNSVQDIFERQAGIFSNEQNSPCYNVWCCMFFRGRVLTEKT